MIWNEELSASLDQSAGVIVFHRMDLSRTQQLAQTLADRANTMVEANEKALDLKFGGGSGWGDRADGKTGDKRGEQTTERKGGRPRGARGKSVTVSTKILIMTRFPLQAVLAEVVALVLLRAWGTKCLERSVLVDMLHFVTSSCVCTPATMPRIILSPANKDNKDKCEQVTMTSSQEYLAIQQA